MISLQNCFFLQPPAEADSDAHFNPPRQQKRRRAEAETHGTRKNKRDAAGFSGVVMTLEERVDSQLADSILQRLDQTTSEYKELLKYREALDADGRLRVNYHSKDYEIGRLYPRPHISLAVMQRQLRGALAHGRMLDVDMENAHPTFLLHEARLRNWRCERLREYVEDRERVLARISNNRTESKVAVLSLINNGAIKPQHQNVRYLQELHEELRGIRDGIWNTYAEIRKLVESGDRSNPRASATSLFMADKEKRALLVVSEAFSESNWEVATLVYDGLIVYRREDRDIDQDLGTVQAKLEERCGAHVKLSVKPWDTSLLVRLGIEC